MYKVPYFLQYIAFFLITCSPMIQLQQTHKDRHWNLSEESLNILINFGTHIFMKVDVVYKK